MTEPAQARHGLESFLKPGAAKDSNFVLTIRADLGHINLRGDCRNMEFAAAAEKSLGQRLPETPNTVSNGVHDIFWLGPSEWLILSKLSGVSKTITDLECAFGDMHVAVNDLSGGQIALSITGESVRELLARGCTLDLHPREFRPGMCAQSGLAKATVLLALPRKDEKFLLVVRRSFADYLMRWLIDAANGAVIRVNNT